MKLEGLRVLDLSVFLPGPYLTMSLADHGAEVIKVEPPGEGDPARHIGQIQGPSTVFFKNLNRGKKSVVIDLKSPDGRETLLRLAETADVFVEAFRPGVVKRLGVDYDAVSARNPRIVYCSISAFGQEGPYRDRPAHSLATEALAGATSLTLGNDDEPAITAIAVGDMISSLQGLSGVLMALLRRQTTGKGDYVDIAMQSSVLTAGPNIMGPAMAEHRQSIPKHERSMGGSAFYQIYRTKDGRHMVLGAQEIKFVRNLLGALGRMDFLPLCEQGPGPHQKPLIDYFRGVFAQKDLAEWVEWFAPMDVSFAPVLTMPEALEDAHLKHRGMILTDDLGRLHLGPAIQFRNEPAEPVLREPGLGEHDAEVLGGLNAARAKVG